MADVLAENDWENGEEEMDRDDDDNESSEEGDGMGDLGKEDSDEEDCIDDALVEKFIRTFDIGNYDIEFDNALSYDRYVPSSDRIGLEKVKEQLQSCIDSVSHGTILSFNLDLAHNSSGIQLMDNEEPIVWNEPILDEYWNRLEEKIDERKHLGILTDIQHIRIVNVEMKKDRLAALVATFRSGRATNSSTMFYFINANLCADGIISLSELVDISSKLQTVRLYHNRMDNMESAHCLSGSLRSHACITWLHLDHCDLGSTPEILLVILQSDVEYINLNNNNIESLGVVKIAEYLEGDPPIRRIGLGHNRLNDGDIIHISQALKRNTNLKTLSLRSNNFTSIGVKALINCVFDGSCLNSISESNHTLTEISFFSEESNRPIQRLDGFIARLLELDRTQKIILALQDKDSLLQYLANIPVELIPEVLAFPLWHGYQFQQVDNKDSYKYLNILYSTMRWWNMPMLYSYHNCVKPDAKRKRKIV
jgi:hypothetical protein